MNAGALHTSDDVVVNDGTGTVTVFVFNDFRRVFVKDSAVGEFQLGLQLISTTSKPQVKQMRHIC